MNLVVTVFAITIIFLETVHGIKTRVKEIISLELEQIHRGRDTEGPYVIAGQSKEISCKASANSYDKKLEWYTPSGELVKKRQAGRRVYAQERYSPVSKSKALLAPYLVLNLSHASVEDSGVWQCRYGDLIKEFPLCVIDPTEFVDTPSTVSLDAGRSTSLTCQTSGNPIPRVLWYRNGELITESSDLSKYILGTKFNSQFVEFFLTVISVAPDDSGVYTCETQQINHMLDECSATTSFNITLEVNHRPSIEGDEMTLKFFSNNESVSLQCVANGFPEPTYKWFEIKNDDVFEAVESFIVADDGTYSNLSVSAAEARYKCEAFNRFGTAEKNFTVLALRKPTKPSSISVSNVADARVEFRVDWDHNDDWYRFPIDEYTIEFKPTGTRKVTRIVEYLENEIEDDDNSTHTTVFLENLLPETEYSVKINIINEAGKSPWYGPILLQTTPLGEMFTEEPIFSTFSEEPFFSTGVIVGLILTVVIVAFAAICITIIKSKDKIPVKTVTQLVPAQEEGSHFSAHMNDSTIKQ